MRIELFQIDGQIGFRFEGIRGDEDVGERPGGGARTAVKLNWRYGILLQAIDMEQYGDSSSNILKSSRA